VNGYDYRCPVAGWQEFGGLLRLPPEVGVDEQ
jgi:hypothetical protein